MEDLVTTILNIQASRYVSAAGVVILLYDHLLTFGDEVELIWQAEWKFPKFLFLLIRYIVVISVLVHTYRTCFSDLSKVNISSEKLIQR
ncbi:hypothetical protein Moror_5812 [Moniliophthora roreri MCA 2997]|uniref:DUF6533 domain-containing protein n=1 Tax=Moniliophthora roreri (strain MCA 2997) TaxID=1381753 RepID=V2Y6D4_MONRO|nr:hypothetical protein Moror_5812 [Moniliophthora roreri MCA 2997]